MSKYYLPDGKKTTANVHGELLENLKESLKILKEEIGEDKCYDHANVMRQFTNEKLKVCLMWNGVISDVDENRLFPSDYPLFRVVVSDKVDGEWRADMSISDFARRSRADVYFEDIIISHSKSYYNEEGEFVPEGNLVQSRMPADITKIKEEIAKEKGKPKTVSVEFGGW